MISKKAVLPRMGSQRAIPLADIPKISPQRPKSSSFGTIVYHFVIPNSKRTDWLRIESQIMKGEVTWMWRLYHVLTTYLIICVSLLSKVACEMTAKHQKRPM